VPVDPDRVECPHCLESMASSARACPHCRREVLFDVAPERPVPDPRTRYQLALRLHDLGVEGSISDLLGLLERGEVVARGLTAQA
jgi:hypothetical protein